MVFFGYRATAQVGAIIRDRPGLVALSTAIAAATVLLLNLLLIPRWGIMGAAYATLGGFATEYFIMRWNSMRVFPLRIEVGVLPLAVAGLTWTLAHLLVPPYAGIPLSIAANGLAFLAFVAGLLATGAITAEQRRFLVRALRDPVASVRALRGA
jgi:O-antigen/teichoic acid export membrane protein